MERSEEVNLHFQKMEPPPILDFVNDLDVVNFRDIKISKVRREMWSKPRTPPSRNHTYLRLILRGCWPALTNLGYEYWCPSSDLERLQAGFGPSSAS